MTTTTEALVREDERAQGGMLVDVAEVPGGGYLHLYRHENDFEILFGDEQLMGSWAFRSEQALATLVADRLGRRAERVLIGGLGMGFTLSAARAAFPGPTAIVVAELVPQVLAWARGPLAEIVGDAIDDPRVSVDISDVHDVIVAADEAYDAILLDVDNGPDGLIHLANERLYCNWGLRAAYAALRPGGMLAVWSAYPDVAFGERLSAAGYEVEVLTVASGGPSSDPPHVIWLASKSFIPPSSF